MPEGTPAGRRRERRAGPPSRILRVLQHMSEVGERKARLYVVKGHVLHCAGQGVSCSLPPGSYVSAIPTKRAG
jgi:hypothetical protein